MFHRRALTTFFAISLATVMAAGTAACGNTADQVEQDPNAQLEIWTRRPPGDPSEQVTKDLADAFTAKTGIKTKVTAIFEDFETKLQQAASQKDLPDLVINDTAQLGTLVDQGLVRPVDQADISGADTLSPKAWDATASVDGENYAVPFSAQAFALFIRSDWREAVDAELPQSWDDLDDLAQKFTEEDPDGNGKDDTYGWVIPGSTKRGYTSWYLSSFLWSGGADYFTETDGKLSPAIDSEAAAEVLARFQGSFCDGTVVPGSETADTATAHPFFDSGTGGMYFTGPYVMSRFDESIGADKLEVVPLPAGPGGESTVLAEGENTYLMAGSANEAGQEKFAEFAASVEGQTIGMDGNDNGNIVRLPVNTEVTMSQVRDDARWEVFDEIYQDSSRYVPTVADWTPFLQNSADTFNAVASDCDADPATALSELAEVFATELDKQDQG